MITVAQALKPVREALTGKADRDAVVALTEAEDTVIRDETEARVQAKEIIDEARAQGEADARMVLAGARAAARRVARATELRAQRQVYEQLRHRVHESLKELQDAEDYPRLRSALATQALMALGPGTVVRDHPAGGVVARAPGRYLEYSLTTLADRALDRIAPELEELWTP